MVELMAIPPDRNMHSDKAPSPSTSEGRKSSKPIMEKRRRARINASLSELKTLLLEVIKKEGSRHSKMEKADILEMTVKHLRQLQRQQFTGSPKTDSNVLNNYRLGFDECAQEVTRYLAQMEVSDVELRSRILNHLANCVSSGIFNPSPPSTPVSIVSSTVSSSPLACASSPPTSQPPMTVTSSQPLLFSQPKQESAQSLDLNNYASLGGAAPMVPMSQSLQMTKVVSGVQVIPTKLQSGEIAFVLPSNVLSSGSMPSYVIPVYPQQTADVHPQPSISAASISAPAYISQQIPIAQAPQHPSPIRSISDIPTAIPNQFISVSSAAASANSTLPSTNIYRPTVTMLPPRPIPPPSTVTSQRLLLEPRLAPLPVEHLNPEQNQNPPQPERHHDESMWRPW